MSAPTGAWIPLISGMPTTSRRDLSGRLEYQFKPSRSLAIGLFGLMLVALVPLLFVIKTAGPGAIIAVSFAVVIVIVAAGVAFTSRSSTAIDAKTQRVEGSRSALFLKTSPQIAFCDVGSVGLAAVSTGPPRRLTEYRVVIRPKDGLALKSIIVLAAYSESTAHEEGERIANLIQVPFDQSPRRGIS